MRVEMCRGRFLCGCRSERNSPGGVCAVGGCFLEEFMRDEYGVRNGTKLRDSQPQKRFASQRNHLNFRGQAALGQSSRTANMRDSVPLYGVPGIVSIHCSSLSLLSPASLTIHAISVLNLISSPNPSSFRTAFLSSLRLSVSWTYVGS